MKYRQLIQVDVHDVDFNGVARCSSLMRYIQTAAQSQLTANELSYDQLRGMSRAFILSRIKMEFTESLYAYDNLTAISYPCDSRGYSFLRGYELVKDGVTIGRAISIWALIDTDTHGLIKVADFDIGIETERPDEFALTRFTLPTAIREVGTYTVNYADLDQNCHMNNTRYPDMYSNFLPMDNKRIQTLSISYVNEARRGERLRVLLAEAGSDTYYIRTLREDGKINTEAEIILTDI